MFGSRLFHWGPVDLTNKPPEGLSWSLTYCNPDGKELLPQLDKLRAIIYDQGPEYYYNSAPLASTARPAITEGSSSIGSTILRFSAGFWRSRLDFISVLMLQEAPDY